MQGTRSAIGSLVVLSLLALPVTAAGQASEPVADVDNPVYLTWEAAPDYWFAVDVPVEAHDWGQRDGGGLHLSFKASDPRVSGDQIIVFVGDSPAADGASDLGRGTQLWRIENDEGYWQGPATAVTFPDDLQAQYGWLTGEGAYEGLSLFLSYYDATASDVHTGQGVIWPGEPPAVPDAALLDADPLD